MGILVALADRPADWQLASDLIERYEQAAVAVSQPMPGLDDVRPILPGRRVAVVTLMGPAAAQETLRRHDIRIPHVIGRRAELRVKPAADQVLAGLRLLGAAPGEAVMIGDSAWDLGAARAAGVEFIGLTNGRRAVEFPPGTVLADHLTEVVALLRG
jgi:HAD superfamily hydrolase (TIGR01509 family)